jgi:hypothetical protein
MTHHSTFALPGNPDMSQYVCSHPYIQLRTQHASDYVYFQAEYGPERPKRLLITHDVNKLTSFFLLC